jgi:hypothetical protein
MLLGVESKIWFACWNDTSNEVFASNLRGARDEKNGHHTTAV